MQTVGFGPTSLSTPGYIKAVSRAYKLAPTICPQAVDAWKALADETSEHFDRLNGAVDIVIVSEANPYPTAYAMLSDIANGRLLVSEANCEHPLWDRDENIRFRVVHDIIGHASTGAGFDFAGEFKAYEQHGAITKDPRARRALFTEAVGQVAYALDNDGFGEQKCAILPQWLLWAYKEHH